MSREQSDISRNNIHLNLKAGNIKINFDNDHTGQVSSTWMDQIIPKIVDEYHNYDRIAEILGIESSDMITEKPLLIISPATLRFLFVPVKEPEIVGRMQPDLNEMANEFRKLNVNPYVFSLGGLDDGDIHARMFAPL